MLFLAEVIPLFVKQTENRDTECANGYRKRYGVEFQSELRRVNGTAVLEVFRVIRESKANVPSTLLILLHDVLEMPVTD